MKKILSEKDFLTRILEDGFQNNNAPLFHELLVLAKHFRQTHGFGEKKLIKSLAEFCLEKNPFFNLVIERAKLKKVSRVAIKSTAFNNPKFPLYFSEREMERLRDIRPFSYQKLIFSAMAVAKSFGSPTIFSQDNKSVQLIIRLSGEKISLNEFISTVSRTAFENGIFENFINRKNEGFYRLLDNAESDIVLKILNIEELRHLSEVYRQFVGGSEVTWCDRCDGKFARLSNRHRFCQKCSNIMRKERTRMRVAKHRKKEKL